MEVKQKIKDFFKNLKHQRRQQLILFICFFVILSIGLWIFLLVFIFKQNPQIDSLGFSRLLPKIEATDPNDDSLVKARALDGMIVSKEDAQQWPVGIMIENAAFGGVRPQSGLAQALVVYEIIVEGGITRFMAVYGGESAEEIGPVRSARDTYLEFASELRSVYGHAGGSYSALQALSSFSNEIVDLNALSADGKYFYRKPTNYAPHNLFTSSYYLDLMLRDKALEKPSEFEPWLFREAQPSAAAEELVDYIKIDFSSPSYLVEWNYDVENNNYKRSNGGTEHVDAQNGQVLTAKNIIIQMVPEGWEIEGKGRINFSVTGSGEAYIFNDGRIVKGTWQKPDRVSRTRYYDGQGQEIEFTRGNFWIEILPVSRSLEYN